MPASPTKKRSTKRSTATSNDDGVRKRRAKNRDALANISNKGKQSREPCEKSAATSFRSHATKHKHLPSQKKRIVAIRGSGLAKKIGNMSSLCSILFRKKATARFQRSLSATLHAGRCATSKDKGNYTKNSSPSSTGQNVVCLWRRC